MWGIPEKNYQKLAQQCKLDHSNVLPAHEMTRSPFAGFSPIVIPIENFKWDGQYRLWVYKFETLRNALYCQDKKSLQRTCPKSIFFFLAQANMDALLVEWLLHLDRYIATEVEWLNLKWGSCLVAWTAGVQSVQCWGGCRRTFAGFT